MWLEDQKKQEWGVQRIPMLMLLRVTPAGVEPRAKLPVKGRGESVDFGVWSVDCQV